MNNFAQDFHDTLNQAVKPASTQQAPIDQKFNGSSCNK
jgi:hypothetical protein